MVSTNSVYILAGLIPGPFVSLAMKSQPSLTIDAEPAKEMAAPIRRRRATMKDMATNGTAKYGFLNLTVNPPKTPVMMVTIPPTMIMAPIVPSYSIPKSLDTDISDFSYPAASLASFK